MRTLSHLTALKVGLLAAALVLFSAMSAESHKEARGQRFAARLSGSNEVPTADSRARGAALCTIDRRGHKLTVEIEVSKIDKVTQAHLHNAAEGANGPVVAFLYGFISDPPEGEDKGLLSCKTITKADLVGPFAGQEMSVLTDAIRDGEIYVNVHTLDFASGEIRGQLK